jgi:hypothetical protein
MGSEGTIYGSSPAGVRRSIDAYGVIPAFGSTAVLTPARVVKVLATGTPAVPANTLYVVTNVNTLRAFTDTMVVAPATTAPAANASVSKFTTFSWTPVALPQAILSPLQYADAASYALNTWITPTIPTGATSYTVPAGDALVPGGKYFWRVKVSQVNALSYSSKTAAPVSFGVKLNETTGDITFLMSPGPGDTGVATKPTFQWTPVTGATGYDLQVSDNPVLILLTTRRLGTNVWV